MSIFSRTGVRRRAIGEGVASRVVICDDPESPFRARSVMMSQHDTDCGPSRR